MTWLNFVRFSAAISIGATVYLSPKLVSACDSLVSQPYVAETYVQAERAVIFWDASTQTEHFVRQASFHTASPDLGFLVPTPQAPELSDVDPSIFDLAQSIGKPVSLPPVVNYTPWNAFAPFAQQPTMLIPSVPVFAPVKPVVSTLPVKSHDKSGVVFEQQVAGYRATVLATEDLPAVEAWLAANGYKSTPEFLRWLKSYADKHWKITAFKMQQSVGGLADGILTSHPVRLSFHTDHPYYPYSEPADRQLAQAESPGGRTLLVSVLSDERMSGALGDGHAFAGQLKYAGTATPGPDDARKWLAAARLSDAKLPSTLTNFRDDSNPRPGTADLYFTRSAGQTAFRAQDVDATLAPVYHLDLTQLGPDLSALLVFVVLPGIPVYCGLRVLSLARQRTGRSPWQTISPARRTIDSLVGALAFIGSMFAAVPIGIGLVIGVVTAFQDPSAILIVPVCLILLTLCVATGYCGRKLAAAKTTQSAVPAKPISLPEFPPIQHVDEFTPQLQQSCKPKRAERVMATASVLTGLIVLVGAVVIFVTGHPLA